MNRVPSLMLGALLAMPAQAQFDWSRDPVKGAREAIKAVPVPEPGPTPRQEEYERPPIPMALERLSETRVPLPEDPSGIVLPIRHAAIPDFDGKVEIAGVQRRLDALVVRVDFVRSQNGLRVTHFLSRGQILRVRPAPHLLLGLVWLPEPEKAPGTSSLELVYYREVPMAGFDSAEGALWATLAAAFAGDRAAFRQHFDPSGGPSARAIAMSRELFGERGPIERAASRWAGLFGRKLEVTSERGVARAVVAGCKVALALKAPGWLITDVGPQCDGSKEDAR